jgi:hypothetical protein
MSATPILTIDLFDDRQRSLARHLFDLIEQSQVPPGVVPSQVPDTQVDIALERHLREVLGLSSGDLLRIAAQYFKPEEQFDMPELSDRSGVDLDTILAKNRTLSLSCKTRGISKGELLTEHGGSPRRFSIPGSVHGLITQIVL